MQSHGKGILIFSVHCSLRFLRTRALTGTHGHPRAHPTPRAHGHTSPHGHTGTRANPHIGPVLGRPFHKKLTPKLIFFWRISFPYVILFFFFSIASYIQAFNHYYFKKNKTFKELLHHIHANLSMAFIPSLNFLKK